MRTMQRLMAGVLVAGTAWMGVPQFTQASDHGDAPNAASDQAADLGDVYSFLDPNDNTKVVLIMTFRGFIVPGEALNLTSFDSNVLYRFDIENTGDAKADASIDVRFSPRVGTTTQQVATITLPGKHNTFTAPTTVASEDATAPAPAITTDPASGVSFYAGLADDPFFFDVPAFSRFVASVKAGAPDATVFQRGRDTFAGYNIQIIALEIPAALLRGKPDNNTIGVLATTSRRTQTVNRAGVVRSNGSYHQIDRAGVAAVNTALVPFARKNEYNSATTTEDAKGKFAADIVATLKSFGTDDAHIKILADVAVTKGDFQRLDLTIPNTGPGGGTNAPASFPNGRRLGDDVIDILLTLINNGNALGDNVNGNDVPLRDAFPFVAAPHQPLPTGTVDDLTRN